MAPKSLNDGPHYMRDQTPIIRAISIGKPMEQNEPKQT